MKLELNTRASLKQFDEVTSDYVKVYYAKKDPKAAWDTRKYALLRCPLITALSVVNKFPLSAAERDRASGFVKDLVVPNFGEVDFYVRRDALDRHRSVSNALERTLNAQSVDGLSYVIDRHKFEPSGTTEVILRNVFEPTSFSFDEKVRIFEVFAREVSEKYILDVANADCHGYGYVHSYDALKKRDYVSGMSFSCNTSLAEWNARYHNEAVQHIEKFVEQEKSFFTYSAFDWESVKHIFGDEFDHVCQVVERLELAKVNNEAEFLRADFRNFCSSLNNRSRDSAMRDDYFEFDSKFRLFHFWCRVNDKGAGTKAVSWLHRWAW